MAKVKNEPSVEHIAYFFERVEYYQFLLNLKDWRIENSGRFANKGCLADVAIFVEDRLAVVSIGKEFGPMPINDKTLGETALHEVLHVFLKNLVDSAASRDPAALDSAEHSIVVVLEKLLGGL